METILNIFYAAPILVGMIIAVIILVVMFAPWKLYWECALMVTAIVAVLVMYMFDEALRGFKNWMRRPASWENDLPDLWI
jgi:hypothetical protein